MSKDRLSTFAPAHLSSLKLKGFEVKRKGPLTIVRCLQCNTEWSIHSSENFLIRRDQLGKHYLEHVAGRSKEGSGAAED